MHEPSYRIIVCRGPECGDRRESAKVHAAFQEALQGCPRRVELGWQSCFGRCRQGPNVLVRPIVPGERPLLFALAGGRGTALYNGVTPADACAIVEEHVVAGQIVRRLIRPLEVHLDADPNEPT